VETHRPHSCLPFRQGGSRGREFQQQQRSACAFIARSPPL
ncbi:MAG: hypothetical protein AVDCRST_MAG44-1147, partial [uncultured Sphingomonas sp.]